MFLLCKNWEIFLNGGSFNVSVWYDSGLGLGTGFLCIVRSDCDNLWYMENVCLLSYRLIIRYWKLNVSISVVSVWFSKCWMRLKFLCSAPIIGTFIWSSAQCRSEQVTFLSDNFWWIRRVKEDFAMEYFLRNMWTRIVINREPC